MYLYPFSSCGKGEKQGTCDDKFLSLMKEEQNDWKENEGMWVYAFIDKKMVKSVDIFLTNLYER